MIKTKKTSAGIYTANINGQEFTIEKVESMAYGEIIWIFYSDTEEAHDVYDTKKEALEALAELANN